jgi:T5SS/PEP-CTERM-associated repeat protein
MSNSFLAVGMQGSNNSLVVNNGGLVTAGSAYVGDLSNSSGNSVLVTGTNSYMSNSFLAVGMSGSNNSLVVNNGGLVTAGSIYIGDNATISNSYTGLGTTNVTLIGRTLLATPNGNSV